MIGAYGLHNLSNDTFRQLKDRRRNRSRQLADKNSGGILRFGSLSVKVKKTTEAFNNYFNSSNPEKKNSKTNLEISGPISGSDNQPYSLPTIGFGPDEDAAATLDSYENLPKTIKATIEAAQQGGLVSTEDKSLATTQLVVMWCSTIAELSDKQWEIEQDEYFNKKREADAQAEDIKKRLKEVCNYSVKRPHRHMWEHKPEYRHYKAPEDNEADKKKADSDSDSD